jgi:hypothetical protein
MKPRTAQQEKELADQARLLREWRGFHRDERNAALAAPHRVMLTELFRLLDNLERVKGAELVDFVASVDWGAVAFSVRLTALYEINRSIIRLREARGLPRIDDGLPGKPENAFRRVRAHVLGLGAP